MVSPPPSQLRADAEAELARARREEAPGGSAEKQLHELQVHRIELEMQNEALRQAQIALEESLDSYADLYNFAPVGYLTLNDSGLIAEINLTGAGLLGEFRSKLLQQHFVRFVAPEDKDAWQVHFRQALTHGGKQLCELRLQRGDGTVFEAGLDCLLTATGDAAPALRIVLTDITARKRAEAGYRSMFDNMLNGCAYCRMVFENGEPKDFVFLNVNNAFASLTGFNDVVGKRVTEVVPGIRESDPGLFEIYGRVTKTGQAELVEVFVEAVQEWFSISVYRPEAEHFVAIFEVITGRRQAQKQLSAANARLEQLAAEQAENLRELASELTYAEQRERDRLYELLHDDMQPLLVAARLALSSVDLRTAAEDHLRVAQQACEHISQVIEVARTLSLQLSPPLIRERGLAPALESLCYWIKCNYGIEVALSSAPDAEPCDVALRLLCFNAVRELLMNVVKHGGTTQVALVLAIEERDSLHITVTDHGSGFDAAAIRVGSGLAAIERRLGMVSGSLQIDSHPGMGTVARIAVPLRRISLAWRANPCGPAQGTGEPEWLRY